MSEHAGPSCVSRAGWARLSGAARLGKGAGHGPTKRQRETETPRPDDRCGALFTVASSYGRFYAGGS